MNCSELERQLVFYVWDELDNTERTAVEEHLKTCAACQAAVTREREVQSAANARPQAEPSAALLNLCRSELAEALEDAAEKGTLRRWLEALRPKSWLILHPAMSTAALLLVGIVLGYGVPQWLSQSDVSRVPATVTVRPPVIWDGDLADISGVNIVPTSAGGDQGVEVHLMREDPIILQSGSDDPQMKQVLMFVVQNEQQRFDSGLRLDSLEVLRAKGEDADVRHALCQAAVKDRNPAVRLKAIEALRGFEQDDQVRQALLDRLLNDENPGVRVEAINALRALTEKTTGKVDERVVEVLRDRMQKDPNTYIRLQSAAAIRDLGPRQSY